MKLYLAIYEDDEVGPNDGILLTRSDRHGTYAKEILWGIANHISWLVRRLGLTEYNAEEWQA